MFESDVFHASIIALRLGFVKYIIPSIKLERGNGFEDVDANIQKMESAIDFSNIGNERCVQERDEQVHTAVKLAAVLIATEIYANAEEISITMNGHANPGHQKSPNSGENVSMSAYISKYLEAE